LLGEGVSQSDKRMQNLQVAWTAVNYTLIGWRIGRNRVLIGPKDGAGELEVRVAHKQKESISKSLGGFRERVALYDATLQSLDSIKELPGVAADAQFLKELSAKRTYFHSLKLLSLARSHYLLHTTQEHKNALALVSNALKNLEAVSRALYLSSTPVPTLEVSSAQASSLHETLKERSTHIHGICELDNAATPSQLLGNLPLIEHLDYFPSNDADLLALTDKPNLVTYPITRLNPVPVKPIFLDIAWNWISYPIGAKATKEELKEEPKKKGWFGFGSGSK
jgi:signal recognition particle subunit SRP68